MNIDKTLEERGSNYGPFPSHSNITQDLKSVMQNTSNWPKLSADKKEALDMIAHKIGRILNGDPEYADSWHDIVGYAQLVENELTAEDAPTVAEAKAAFLVAEKNWRQAGGDEADDALVDFRRARIVLEEVQARVTNE